MTKSNTRRASGVYLIRRKSTGSLYAGSSVHIPSRWLQHKAHLRRGVHHNMRLQRVYDKYGPEEFELLTVGYCERDDLIRCEQLVIDALHANGVDVMNTCPVAGSNLGRKLSEETKRKMIETRRRNGTLRPPQATIDAMIEANRGRIISDEHRAKLSEASKSNSGTPARRAQFAAYIQKGADSNRGKPISQERVDALVAINTGSHRSAESKAKMSRASLGRKKTSEHRAAIKLAAQARGISEENKAKMREGCRVAAERRRLAGVSS